MAWELASFPRELMGEVPPLEGVDVDIVRPGEEVRVTHVLDAVEPRIRPDGRPAFPREGKAGEGRTNRLDGVVALSCLDFLAEERPLHEQDSIVDLAGPAGELAPFAGMTAVVLTFRPDPDAGNEAAESYARLTTLRVAEELARPTLDADPFEVEQFELPDVEELPRIAAVVQLSDLGPLYYQYVYGVPAGDAGLPRVVDPAELLDGAVTCGEYHWASIRNPTLFHQRNALVRALYREHGKRLSFVGLVLARGYEQTAADKQRAAEGAARFAAELGADGAIVTTDGGGNSHTDSMLTVRALERAGIRTAVIVAEQNDPTSTEPALVDWVPEADCIVSTGNMEELVPSWTPDRVLGGDRLLDGRPAADPGEIRVQDYLGVANQMGQLDLSVRTW
jgi:sarcosine reductase